MTGSSGRAPGTIVVLNGAPRSGKSTIAGVLQRTLAGPWLNLGVDAMAAPVTPGQWRPGIGLRPGGERPDLEAVIPALFDVLYAAVIAASRRGLNVVVDVGHHDDYSQPLGVLTRVARDLAPLPAYFIGVRCAVAVIMDRRDASPGSRYESSAPDGGVPDAVGRWERAVHDPGIYDLEVDTSMEAPETCAAAIAARVRQGPPTAFATLATPRHSSPEKRSQAD